MKYLFLIALFSLPAHAQKVLFVTEDKQQILINLGPGGKVGEKAEVVWDENVHGKIDKVDDYEIVSREDYLDQVPSGKQNCDDVIVPGPASGESTSEIQRICTDVMVSVQKHRLVSDAAKVSAKAAKKIADDADKLQKKNELAAFRALKAKIDNDTATLADLRKAIKFLLTRVNAE